MNNLTVCKANEVVEAGYRLTLNEQRVILACIAQINSTEELEPLTAFEINVKDFSKFFNLSEAATYSDLQEIVRNLYHRSLTIYNPGRIGNLRGLAIEKLETRWINSIGYLPNEGRIILVFSQEILPYLSGLRGSFTRYELKYVAGMSSIYGIRLYELLMQWRGTGKRTIEIAWLKQQFKLDNSYDRMFDLKKRVIEPAVKDINTHSNFIVAWEQIKTGRVVTHLIFTFEEKNKPEPEAKPAEPKPKATITLTEEQQKCFEWAKNHDYWKKVTTSKKSFLTCYNKLDGAMKAQFEAAFPAATEVAKSAKPKTQEVWEKAGFKSQKEYDNFMYQKQMEEYSKALKK